ncbi:MAG: 23S rRNA (pseudouridine(1915)-N(3))-methyltransferase RlmH [Chloracidobacterium sp.]|uniref:Ribosomal RNA large subunit methyltransferase H n=1 Tax=Chloracidobacterium validum TaxID=2821543 RepID=A0ABX8B6L1_9BACT|nr:23S rRNA (pseudouridine(1915)-N(3))-methyltransferase RlmH [Chloracidobacterium validum]QUW02602.1 23S rRNA (pseudouridine(1915)-N(3))-methyltransferase RlmH [Chloracidobacterium validum]
MRVTFFVVGKTKSAHWDALAHDYGERIRRFVPGSIQVVREAEPALAANPELARAREAKHLLAALPASAYVVLLDVAGEVVSSEALAEKMRKWRDTGVRDLCFVTGGHWGVTEAVRQRADWRWSLSKLTFTHEMARVLAAEQVYRALARLANVPYAK